MVTEADVHIAASPETSDVILDWSSEVGPVNEHTECEVNDGWSVVSSRKGKKRASSWSPSRDQVKARSCAKLTDRARKVMSKGRIVTEDAPWISCVECMSNFSSYVQYTSHMKEVYDREKTTRVPCPWAACELTCNDPKEWVNHLCAKHPQYVLQYDVEVFDKYF